MGSDNKKILLIAILVVVVVSVFLIAFSFERIRYDEYALLKNNFLHKISYDEKHTEPGIYFIGIEKSFIKFPKYLIFLEFSGDPAEDDKKKLAKLQKEVSTSTLTTI